MKGRRFQRDAAFSPFSLLYGVMDCEEIVERIIHGAEV
jgi:hypothetical protein